jgi:hypothetical protein
MEKRYVAFRSNHTRIFTNNGGCSDNLKAAKVHASTLAREGYVIEYELVPTGKIFKKNTEGVWEEQNSAVIERSSNGTK